MLRISYNHSAIPSSFTILYIGYTSYNRFDYFSTRCLNCTLFLHQVLKLYTISPNRWWKCTQFYFYFFVEEKKIPPQVLKLYAWEPSFEKQVLTIRHKEIGVLKKAAYLNAFTSFIFTCTPFMVSCWAVFALFVMSFWIKIIKKILF